MICDPNYGFTRFLNTGGTAIVLTVAFLSGLILATPFSLLGLVMRFTPKEREAGVMRVLSERFRAWRQKKQAARENERLTEAAEHVEEEWDAAIGAKESKEGARLSTASSKVAEANLHASRQAPMIAVREEVREIDEETKVGKRPSFTTLGLFGSKTKDKQVADDKADTSAEKAPAQATLFKPAVKVPVVPKNGDSEQKRNEVPGSELQEAAEVTSTSAPGLADRVSSRFRLSRLRGRPATESEANGEGEAATDDVESGESYGSTLAADDLRGSRVSQHEQALDPRNARVRTLDEMLASATVRRAQDFESDSKPVSRASVKTSVRVRNEFKVPTTEMLSMADARPELADTELRDRAQQLAEKCREFNVAGVVKQISPGSGRDDI